MSAEAKPECQSFTTMSNFKTQLLILILLLVPVALPEPEPEAIQALVRRLNSKKPSASVQEAAAKAVLKRLLPTHVTSFDFKIVSEVLSTPLRVLLFYFSSASSSGCSLIATFIILSCLVDQIFIWNFMLCLVLLNAFFVLSKQ